MIMSLLPTVNQNNNVYIAHSNLNSLLPSVNLISVMSTLNLMSVLKEKKGKACIRAVKAYQAGAYLHFP